MDPLRLTPCQWRALRYLAVYSTSASRVGFRASQLRERTGVSDDDLGGLADLGHIAGRLHGSTESPLPSIVITARAHPKLRIHLTKSGKRAAREIAAGLRALEMLHIYGPATVEDVRFDAGVSDDTLTRLFRLGRLRHEVNEHDQVVLSLTEAGRAYADPYSA
ncbi:hypothetical protein ABZ912_53590 [Nonomuraea angiospora]|uniref:hypothetical protein n=1 Tax=Nonomuraea angiospora TaxID=46172 RepID=UPI0033E4A1BF